MTIHATFPSAPATAAPEDAVHLLSDEELHRSLAHWNHRRLAVGVPSATWRDNLREDLQMQLLEGGYIETFRAEIAERVREVPNDTKGFMDWFESLKATGPGQHDALFDWLSEEATLEELRWFLCQEAAGEAGFDDLVALTQVKLLAPAKLELARNYWDEMGRGSPGGMHGPMLDRTIKGLRLNPSIDGTAWQSLALANTMTAFAATRRYTYHSVGALGVVELTAPTRVAKVAQGMKRLGLEPKLRKYFDLHAILDVKHSEEWNKEAIQPLADNNPESIHYIAEGALMRLICGARCFDAYRKHLWDGDRL